MTFFGFAALLILYIYFVIFRFLSDDFWYSGDIYLEYLLQQFMGLIPRYDLLL